MIAVDTNILVYAHRRDSRWHEAAMAAVTGLAEGRGRWAIPWPCVHEFLAVVTHPRIYEPPTATVAAIDQVEAWMESPSLVLVGEAGDYWPTLRQAVLDARISGPRIHDARIMAICRQQGARELWTVDRDFGRFSGLRLRNPLV
jgi:toxin-antitoxin system PIN domain toxin